MNKAKVWLDDFYLFVEVTLNNGNVTSFEEYGNVKPFSKEYVKKILAYKYGDIEIQFM